jgi:hypothetical protein
MECHDEKDGEYYMYLLSLALLEDKPFELPPDADLTPHYKYVIQKALEASAVIDTIPAKITHNV